MTTKTFSKIAALLPFALPLYVVRFHVGPLPTTVLEVIILILLTYWLVSLSFLRRQESSLDRSGVLGWIPAFAGMTPGKWFWPIICWLIAGLIAVFVAQDHIAALGLWRAYFLEPILIFVMLQDVIRSEEDRMRLLRWTMRVSVILAIWAVLQWARVLPIPSPWDIPPNGIRATGPFPFPNALALFAAPVAALGIATLRNKRLTGLALACVWTGTVASILSVALAKSAGGLIAVAAAAFIALILEKKTRLLAIGGTIAAILFILVIPSIRAPVTQKIFFDAWSGKVRLVMWQETWNMLRDRPVVGAGLGGYPDAILPYHRATWMEVFQYPHNILLNLWSETGLLGIVAFGWILWVWISKKDTWRYTLPVVAAILVHSLVDVPYFKNDLAILFWVLIILTSSSLPESDGAR